MLDFVLDISISPRISMNAPLSSPYVVRDRSKFTGYLGRVLVEKKSLPLCRWTRPGYPVNFDRSLTGDMKNWRVVLIIIIIYICVYLHLITDLVQVV